MVVAMIDPSAWLTRAYRNAGVRGSVGLACGHGVGSRSAAAIQRTRRRMPSFSETVLKLRSSPMRHPLMRRYVRSWASCNGRISSTDFNSRMTVVLTIMSAR